MAVVPKPTLLCWKASPSNKRAGTPGWLQYTRKRHAYLAGAAHFVEIDLLRGGRRMPMQDDWPDSPY